MKLKVKTYATLQKFSPPNTPLGQEFSLNINGKTILDVINNLGIPSKEKLIIMVNGIRKNNYEEELNEEDLVVFFPQLGGG